MDTIFPLNLPAPTLWYVVLYVVTLLLHALFMAYVLGGCIMLGIAGARGMLGRPSQDSHWVPVTTILKEWMPFLLSAAITAGIAPLLFVQILYQQEFYTANLLSFHRWMAILPVLIIAFYLLYLLKAHRIEGKVALQGIVAMIVMACILFVGWSWVENHVLSLHRGAWADQYATSAMVYTHSSIPVRLGFWILSAFPVTVLWVMWQFKGQACGITAATSHPTARPLAALGLITTILGALAAWPGVRGVILDSALSSVSTNLWLGIAMGGALLGLIGFALIAARNALDVLAMLLATCGTVAFWLGVLLARESIRWSVTGTANTLARHVEVGTIAGFVIFLTFAVLGIGCIAWIFRAVAKGLSAAKSSA